MSRDHFRKATHGFFKPGTCPVDDTNWLPLDLSMESSLRMGTAAGVYAACYFLAYFVSGASSWIGPDFWRHVFLDVHSITAWIAILMAAMVVYMTRCGHFSARRLLDIGLVFMVLGAIGITANTFWGLYPDGRPDTSGGNGYMGIPWEGVWIVVFPVIAPNKPLKILVAALIAASAGPATMYISRWAGATHPDVNDWFIWRFFLFSSYLCAFLSFFSSSFIQKLGEHLRQAREVGNYELVSRLGMGGMGEVWRAKHRMLARPAAVKLIKREAITSGSESGSGADSLQARFEREAQATALLQSPHTVRLYDFGRTEDGSFFYAMELLSGISLDELVLRYGPQPPERVAFILRQLCHSLDDAHKSGLVHRDIKPGNILLCALGQDRDFVKVLDFGLVKAIKRGSTADTGLTQPGITAGTPAYLAPEMVLGRHDLDGRTDLYSLGCVAYWLLTGVPVFEGANSVEVAAMHLKDTPRPPSKMSEFDISAEFEALILACLAKSAADRPVDAAVLAKDLCALDLGEMWSWDQARKWWDVHQPCAIEDTCPAREK